MITKQNQLERRNNFNMVDKVKKSPNGLKESPNGLKEKHRYIFPSKMAKKMKAISTRAQLEASMLSMTLICIGMILFIIFQLIYGEGTLLFRGMLIFNLLCGIVLLGAGATTTYQQYVNHMEIMGMDADEEKKKIKASGNIFKRIFKAFRKKGSKKGKKEYPSTLNKSFSAEDREKLNKIQMLDNMEYSKEILENQGKVEFNIQKDRPRKIKVKKTKVDRAEEARKLIEMQREMLEE